MIEQDFDVTFSGSGVPNIELIEGEEWIVYAELISNGDPANIDSLTIAPGPNSSDVFIVKIANGKEPGADSVGTINLTAANWTGSSSLAGGSLIDGDLTGALTVAADGNGNNGRLDLEIWGQFTGSIVVPTITRLEVSALMSGDITVTETVEKQLVTYGDITDAASITIADIDAGGLVSLGEADDFAAQLTLGSGIPAGATVRISGFATPDAVVDLNDGNLVGDLVFVYGGSPQIINVAELSGSLRLTTADEFSESAFFGSAQIASVASTGTIWAAQGSLLGALNVAGDMNGGISIDRDVLPPDVLGTGGSIEIGGDMSTGKIRIYGTLANSVSGAEITVGGSLGSSAYIVVDYDADGWTTGDEWASGATVQIGDDDPITGNSPNDQVWEIQPYKADLDNSGAVNFLDIDPFLMALFEPGTYATTYPALAGSMQFHGDVAGPEDDPDECDFEINFLDSNAFVDRVFDGCPSPFCGVDACTSFNGGEPPSPEELAHVFLNYGEQNRLAALVESIKQASPSMPEERQEYWDAVAEELQQ